MISFSVPGEPVPCGRARVVRSKEGKSHAFNPKRTTDYQALVRKFAKEAVGSSLPEGYRGGKFSVEIWVYRTGAGDTDNYAKNVLDACTGVLWHDDRQVYCLYVELHDLKKGIVGCDGPYVDVRIKVLGPPRL